VRERIERHGFPRKFGSLRTRIVHTIGG
jgi:hypothetical protein